MARVDTGPAVHARAARRAELLVAPPQVARRLEPAIRPQVAGVGRAQGAGYVTCLRVDGFGFAPVPLPRPRVENRHVANCANCFEIDDPSRVRCACLQLARPDISHFGLERFTPRLQAAVEHRLGGVAEVTEQEPEPCRHRSARVVVHDDGRRGADARLAHLALELRRGGQRMPACSVLALDRLEVDEDGARDMAPFVLLASVAALQVPAEVDHADVGVVDVFAKPAGLHQRSEPLCHHVSTTRVSWQKCTVCGCDSCSFFSDRVHWWRSACWPGHDDRSALSASREIAAVAAASPIITATPPSASTNTLWWPTVCPGVATTRTPSATSASPSRSSNRAPAKSNHSAVVFSSRRARSSSARWM